MHYFTPRRIFLAKCIILPKHKCISLNALSYPWRCNSGLLHYFTPTPIYDSRNALFYPQTYIFLSKCFNLPPHIHFAKCIILPPEVYFWSTALFYPHPYISFAKYIILPPDAYFWPNTLFYPQT